MCDYSYTTGWITAGSEDEARLLAEKEARQYFNGCYKCGRWICDEHYDKNEMMCVDCAQLAKEKTLLFDRGNIVSELPCYIEKEFL
jgi:uncharacterized OB-fold protein